MQNKFLQALKANEALKTKEKEESKEEFWIESGTLLICNPCLVNSMLSEKTGNSCYRWYKQDCSSWHISEKKWTEIAFPSLFLDFQHQIGIKLYVMMKVTLSNNISRK